MCNKVKNKLNYKHLLKFLISVHTLENLTFRNRRIRTKAFLVKFDKKQTFIFIPAILFLYVHFLFFFRVPEKVTSRSLKQCRIWKETCLPSYFYIKRLKT